MGTKTFMKYNYELKRSKRKTLCLEVAENLDIIVRAPINCPKSKIDEFVIRHENWIEKNLKTQKNREYLKPLTNQEVENLKKSAKEVIPKRVEYYSKVMGLFPTGVKITSAQKRLGSCSYKNSLCFSYKLMQFPQDVIDYVVVHELAHIEHKNHSNDFYELISQYIPGYKDKIFVIKNM